MPTIFPKHHSWLRGWNKQRFLGEIRQQAAALRTRSDSTLTAEVAALREQYSATTANPLVVKVFALTFEALRRTTGMEYYDVQLQAGRALAQGRIAEMQTGEGKTIVAALPACLHALSGHGVHIATTNEYLSNRDFEIISPLLRLLGFSVGLLPASHNESAARQAYQCDVTYGTGHQFGFDYLRDQLELRNRPTPSIGTVVHQKLMSLDWQQCLLQRSPAFAIVDEIDSVLLDEANTPLILSDQAKTVEDENAYLLARDVVASFVEGEHYHHHPASWQLKLTQQGAQLAMDCLQSSGLKTLSRPWLKYIQNALHSEVNLKRDVDYVVDDDGVRIVDRDTGRLAEDRRWSDGLHQAVEAKEDVEITPPNHSQARVTRQRYFRRYPLLCGMTGTATGSEGEFRGVFGLAVEQIPLHRPSLRRCEPTRYFATLDAKARALVDEVRRRHLIGQPVLIGTRTIESSKYFSDRLNSAGLKHVVLNGVQDEEEAAIVARAGNTWAITIATNMAGRGTDISLDDASAKLGGLHVFATEHHESRRVDRQLVGRCARQGQPGSCQFMISAEDDLIAKHAPQLAGDMLDSAGGLGECRNRYDSVIRQIQDRLQKKQFEQRRRMMEQDNWTDLMLTGFLQ